MLQVFEGGDVNNVGNAGRIAARYVHSGNTVVQPTALDKTTGIYTCAGGLLTAIGAAGTVSSKVVIGWVVVNAVLPREVKAGEYHKIEVISDTTFYLQNSSTDSTYTRISSYPDAGNTGTDATKFWFELGYPTSLTINLNGLNLNEILVRIHGCRARAGQTYLNLQGTHDGGNYSAPIGVVMDGKDTMYQFGEFYWKYEPANQLLVGQVIRSAWTYWNETTSGIVIGGQQEMGGRILNKFSNFQITGMNVAHPMGNGYTIDVFDLRGE